MEIGPKFVFNLSPAQIAPERGLASAPGAETDRRAGGRERREGEARSFALGNFGRLASLPVILVSRVTQNRADPFGERDVKR